MRKPIAIILVLMLLVVALSTVRIFVSNNVATSGVLLEKIQEDLGSYKLENVLLAEKLYTESSLTKISQKATDSGFKENKTDFVINGQFPVAFKQ